MAKRVLLITGSPRMGGNSDLLADAFMEGALQAGHTVLRYDVGRMRIGGCAACEYCLQNRGVCALQDDMRFVYPDLASADVLVLATPVYYFGFTAQLKCFIDRMYAFVETGTALRESALLLVCADTEPETTHAAVLEYQKIAHYLELVNRGVVWQCGVQEKRDIAGLGSLADARALGANL